MFDVGDFTGTYFWYWALKAERLNRLWNYTYFFYRFSVCFQNPKTFYVFWSCCTRFIKNTAGGDACLLHCAGCWRSGRMSGREAAGWRVDEACWTRHGRDRMLHVAQSMGSQMCRQSVRRRHRQLHHSTSVRRINVHSYIYFAPFLHGGRKMFYEKIIIKLHEILEIFYTPVFETFTISILHDHKSIIFKVIVI